MVLHRGEELPISSVLPGTNDPTPALPQGTRDFSAIKAPTDSELDFRKQCQSMYNLSLTLQITAAKSTSLNFLVLLLLVSLS